MKKKIISCCPVCESRRVVISGMTCGECGSRLETEVPIPPFFNLPPDLQAFVMVFLRRRGNIREVEKELGISYPTVCKKLEQVNRILENGTPPPSKLDILEMLERGAIDAQEAAKLLRTS